MIDLLAGSVPLEDIGKPPWPLWDWVGSWGWAAHQLESGYMLSRTCKSAQKIWRLRADVLESWTPSNGWRRDPDTWPRAWDKCRGIDDFKVV